MENAQEMRECHKLLVEWGIPDTDAKAIVLDAFLFVGKEKAKALITQPPAMPLIPCCIRQRHP